MKQVERDYLERKRDRWGRRRKRWELERHLPAFTFRAGEAVSPPLALLVAPKKPGLLFSPSPNQLQCSETGAAMCRHLSSPHGDFPISLYIFSPQQIKIRNENPVLYSLPRSCKRKLLEHHKPPISEISKSHLGCFPAAWGGDENEIGSSGSMTIFYCSCQKSEGDLTVRRTTGRKQPCKGESGDDDEPLKMVKVVMAASPQDYWLLSSLPGPS
ncbi:hypothetical protein H6P81_014896 [Aristolochia fimbriata]|uniref:Uncharacterized protein n=1 Tax=Aristolochia fimbriata TaxID=158543 RepID=A0AAV7E5B2_ARIFI|nr:hypothetical protein H6P81_014896 [Aristolochia fimbriata]